MSSLSSSLNCREEYSYESQQNTHVFVSDSKYEHFQKYQTIEIISALIHSQMQQSQILKFQARFGI